MPKLIPILAAVAVIPFAACHKTLPIASRAPAPSPAVSTPATSRPVTSPVRSFAPASTPQPVAARPSTMTREERETLNQRLAHLSDALFDYDKATIRTDALTALTSDVNVVKDILSNYPSQKLIVEGDTDERGSAEYNLVLGDKRAHAAAQFLMTMGIPESRLTILSYGKERQICEDHDESCWQKNRRAHITAAP